MRVLVVEDHELVRRGICLVLESQPGIEVVGQARDGREALALVNTDAPDVVLSDARMPHLDGPGLVRACARLDPPVPVVVLTTFDDEEIVRSAIDAGAAGFLLKDSAPEAIVNALEAAVRGELVVDQRVTRVMLARPRADPLAELTPTERDVAALVATGASNAEIAAQLHLSHGTVKNHVSMILRKLEQPDRTRLALHLARLETAGGSKPEDVGGTV